jgi:O-antigen/teichoic acid export membrane protein
LQDDLALLRAGYLKLLRIISIINFPLFLGLCAVAPLAVPLIFGEKWTPAVPLVQILALVGVFYSTGNPAGSLVLARGRADLGFWWQVWAFVGQSIAIALSAWLGNLVTVALTLLGLQLLLFTAGYLFLLKPLLGRFWRQYLSAFLPSLGCSLLMLLVLEVLLPRLPLHGTARYFSLGLLVALGGLIYLASALAFQPRQVREMFQMLVRRSHKEPQPQPAMAVSASQP